MSLVVEGGVKISQFAEKNDPSGISLFTFVESGENYKITRDNLFSLISFPEVNDLTSSVTWANVPDANITFSSVNQHLAGYQLLSEKGAADGYAPLNGSSKIDASYLPDSILGKVDYQGTWDASTNTPAIPAASTANKGYYYIVINSVGSGHGYTNVPAVDFVANDWIISSGASWDKVDNTETGGFTVTNEVDNRVITSTGAGTGNAEANLTFDGTLLNVSSGAPTTGAVRLGGTGANTYQLQTYDDAATTGYGGINIIRTANGGLTRLGFQNYVNRFAYLDLDSTDLTISTGSTTPKIVIQPNRSNSTEEYVFSETSFYPETGSSVTLGESTKEWGAAYVDNILIDGNTISSTDTNGNINLTPDGTGSVVLPTANTPSSPTLEFGSGSGTGIYDGGSNILRFSANGTEIMRYYSGGVVFSGNIARWGSDSTYLGFNKELFGNSLHMYEIAGTPAYSNAIASSFYVNSTSHLPYYIDGTLSNSRRVALFTDEAEFNSTQIDNILIDGNTISSTDTDGNLVLAPNGTGQVVFPNGSAALPGIRFSDSDTGFHQGFDGIIGVSIAGTNRWSFQGGRSGDANYAQIMHETPSATNPVFVAKFTDPDTGIGSNADDQLSLIAGGVEGIRVEATQSTFSGDIVTGGLVQASNIDDGHIIGRLAIDYHGSGNPTLSSAGGNTVHFGSTLSFAHDSSEFSMAHVASPSADLSFIQLRNSAAHGISFHATTTSGTSKRLFISSGDTGSVVISDAYLEVGNINIDGNTISSTDTNGDIILAPDGTGQVLLNDGSVAFPSIAFANYPDMGMWASSSNTIRIEAGTSTFQVDNSGIGHSSNGKGIIRNATTSATVPAFAPNRQFVTTGLGSSNSLSLSLIGGATEILRANGVASAVNYLDVTNSITGSGIILSSAGTDANVDINITPKGTGTISTSAGHTANISAADDVITKGYADANYAGGSGDMVLASAQTNSGVKTFLNTTMKLRNVANTFDGYFVNTNTADRIYTLQNAPGTIAFLSDITGTNSGTNTGDQTSIVGITGTKAQFDTAVTDGNFMFIGDAPTAHTHLLSAGATDVTATATELNLLDLSGLTSGWVLSADTATTASWKAPTLGTQTTNGTITIEFYNSGSDLTTGIKDTPVQVPYGGTINSWEIMSYNASNVLTSTTAEVEVLSDTFGSLPLTGADDITASASPTLTAASTASGAATGWSTLVAGNYIQGEIVSVGAGIAKIVLTIKVTRSN
jgi:hypothetical protein